MPEMSSITPAWSLLASGVCFLFVMVMKVVISVFWVKTSFALISVERKMLLFQYFYQNDKMNCATGEARFSNDV